MTSLFNSSQIPGEILDLTVVRTDVLNRPDGSGQKFAKALTGAWYEMLAQMSQQRQGSGRNRRRVAGHAGVVQGAAQHHQDVLHAAVSRGTSAASPELKQKMALVRQFCFDHGLLGANTKSVDDVAIQYPGRLRAGQGRTASGWSSTSAICSWRRRGSCRI